MHMTAIQTQTERNRQDRSARWGADPCQPRINLAAEAINHAPFALQMPELRHSGLKKLDQHANGCNTEWSVFYLGNVG
jgi:hypothetical protein